MATLADILARVKSGQRISPEEAAFYNRNRPIATISAALQQTDDLSLERPQVAEEIRKAREFRLRGGIAPYLEAAKKVSIPTPVPDAVGKLARILPEERGEFVRQILKEGVLRPLLEKPQEKIEREEQERLRTLAFSKRIARQKLTIPEEEAEKKYIENLTGKVAGFLGAPSERGKMTTLKAMGGMPSVTDQGVRVAKPLPELTTRVLNALGTRSTVSRQFIQDLTNMPELRQSERDLIRSKLAEISGDTIDVQNFANSVQEDLLPLKRMDAAAPAFLDDGRQLPFGYKYEAISLPKEQRGNVQNYSEHVYSSPIETAAGNVHYSKERLPNYFAHTRIEDLPHESYIEGEFAPSPSAKGTTRRVIEVQSDLFQKGKLEGEVDDIALTELKESGLTPKEYDKTYSGGQPVMQDAVKRRDAIQKKLEPYRNTWYERIIREEVKKAAQDGKTKIQFPTGETAMKIEGLGETNTWFSRPINGTRAQINAYKLKPDVLKVGQDVYQNGNEAQAWIITDVLGDGKFKAVLQKVFKNATLVRGRLMHNIYDKRGKKFFGELPEHAKETFDISGKVDTNNPIYKFYEKEVAKFLKREFPQTKLVTDRQGVTWNEVDISRKPNEIGYGERPIFAFKTGGSRKLTTGEITERAQQKKSALEVTPIGKLIQKLVPKISPKVSVETSLFQELPEGQKILQAERGFPKDVSKIVSRTEDTTKINIGQTINTKRLNISGDSKKLIEDEFETLRPRLQKSVGKTLTNQEAQDLADQSSRVLTGAVGRQQTLQWEAALLKLRQRMANVAQDGEVTKEFLDDIVAVKNLGADIGRKLQSFSIGADPKLVTSKQAILGEVLKVTNDTDKILKAAQGVDFNNFQQATAFYRQFVKPSFGEWVDLIRYNSMLSSPLTHMVNIFSNLTNSTIRAPLTKLIAGGIDLLSSKATGKARIQFAGEAGAYMGGYLKSFQDAFKNFADTWKGTRAFTHLDLQRQIPLTTRGMPKVVERILSVPMRLLEGADQFFMTLATSGEKAALKLRQVKGIKIPRLEEAAEEAARYGIFRQELFKEGQGTLLDAIDVLTSKILSLRSSSNPIVSTIAKFTVPFVSTPMNIFKQGIEYSPTGFATIFKAANKTEQLAKAMIGTGVATVASTLIATNRMTWGEPRMEEERNAWRENGVQPYSVKIGNRWFQYSKLPPFIAFPFAMIAGVYDAGKNRKLTDTDAELILSSVSKYANFLADQSYFKNFGDFFDAIAGNEFAVSRLIGNYPQQLIPYRALGGWLARLTDSLQRKIDNRTGFIDKQIQLLMQNIPFLSQQLPPRIGSSGQPIGVRDRTLNALSPIRTISQTPAEEQSFGEREELKQILRRQSETRKSLKEQASNLDGELSGMSKEEANAHVQELQKINPQLYEALKNVVEERKQTLRNEKKIRQLGVENGERAKYIHKQIMKLPTSGERNALYAQLKGQRIITPKVSKQLVELLAAEQK